MSVFNTLYKQLNPEQKKAVDAIDGPVMVIAGPGTGKTQILTLRIANILKNTDTSPDSILALTFTESGVFSMRKRLVEMIGSEGYRVNIYTFHGFCNEIIKASPDSFPRIIGANNINDIDKIGILKESILNLELKYLKPFGDNFYYIHALRSKISELKRENISPGKLALLIKKQKNEYDEIEDLTYDSGAHKGKIKGKYRNLEKQIAKNEELLILYSAYEEALERKRYYDYDDMIVETIKALEGDADLLLSLQEEYQYILADEHQDANNAQNRLLELLTDFHDDPNLFIVGDEKQAIFRFQGASLDNFLYFKNRYKNALLITLEDNYRSSQQILDSAHSLIQKGPIPDEKLRKELTSHRTGEHDLIKIRSFKNTDYELLFLADDIKQKIEDGVKPEEIAVIYRNNKDSEYLSYILEKTAIPFSVESDQNILRDHDVAKFIGLLNAVHHFGEDAYLLPLLHTNFLKLKGLDIYKLLRYGRDNKVSLHDIMRSTSELKKVNVESAEQLSILYTQLEGWKKVSENGGVLDAVQRIASESGFIDYALGHAEAVEKLEKIGGLFRDITQLIENHKDYTFKDLIDYFNDVHEHNILIRKDSKHIGTKSVRLMTAHKSKGLEFDYVYIIGSYNGHWGNQRSVQHFKTPLTSDGSIMDIVDSGDEKNDDERRLFYVALTRAKIGAHISYAREGATGKQQLPAQFIEEIDEHLVENIETEEFEKKCDTTVLLQPGDRVIVPPVKDKHFLNELFLEQGLSVTALNNYINCPWRYFYSNLLRVPRVPTKHLLFGTVVHKVMHDYFAKLKAGENVNEKTMMKLFNDYINQEPFTESELKEAIAKGEAAFPGYYKKYHKQWATNVLTEFKISVLLPVELGNTLYLKLRGDIDKIEIFDNERGVNVVDYKTGKPKSRNHIEGKTKTSNGDYKRQLVFYNLLLNLYDNGKYTMASGEIDFIEPDDKGVYHKEQFEITEDEVSDLHKQVGVIAQEILDLSFWDNNCDDKDCEYCELRKKMEI